MWVTSDSASNAVSSSSDPLCQSSRLYPAVLQMLTAHGGQIEDLVSTAVCAYTDMWLLSFRGWYSEQMKKHILLEYNGSEGRYSTLIRRPSVFRLPFLKEDIDSTQLES